MEHQLKQYIPVLMLAFLAIAFSFGTLVMSVLVGKRGKREPIKDTAYECGMLPIGEGNTRLSVKFYLVAMLFILFDIEVVFLYPWAVVYKQMLANPATRNLIFEIVRLATQGVAMYLRSEMANPQSAIYGREPVIILGHDTRFLGREFSLAAAEVLTHNQIAPLLCQRNTPTPVISYTIRNRKAIGGINMTASHNPAEYQGLKFSTSNGAPATQDVTRQIEANIAQLQAKAWSF